MNAFFRQPRPGAGAGRQAARHPGLYRDAGERPGGEEGGGGLRRADHVLRANAGAGGKQGTVAAHPRAGGRAGGGRMTRTVRCRPGASCLRWSRARWRTGC